MAYKRNPLAIPDQFLDRAREGIKPPREQDHLIGRKRRFRTLLELEVFFYGRRIDDRPELELVAVIGKEAQRLDERGQDGFGRPEAGPANRISNLNFRRHRVPICLSVFPPREIALSAA